MKKLTFLLALGCVLWLTQTTAQIQAADVTATSVAAGLENPCGVTTHPRNGNVLVSALDGVYLFRARRDYEKHLFITGFKSDDYGKGPVYKIGPLGLAFLDNRHLIVGDGSLVDGQEKVYVFQLSRDKRTHTTAEATHVLGPIGPQPETPKGEGNFYGVAAADGHLFFSCNGDDTKGWIAKVNFDGEKPGAVKLFIASKQETGVDAPVALTFTSDKKSLVVSQMGEMNVPNDSLLTMYDPASGKLEKKYKTGLYDISGLAYSPKTGKLYATDFAWMKTSEGGLFELSIQGEEVKAKKVLSLDKPTALAFDHEGRLFITVFGTSEPGKPAGSLLKIEAGL